jgi:hypothetical protein
MARRLSRVDREALTRAIVVARSESPDRAEQIDEKLKEDPWLEVAEFAAYVAQNNTLHLKSQQIPPCWIDDPYGDDDLARDLFGLGGTVEARALCRRLLEAGLSRYEPDPIAALEKAGQMDRSKAGPMSHAPDLGDGGDGATQA